MSVAVCPGCVTGTDAAEEAAAHGGLPTHELVVPGVHCMACIRTVENTLAAMPGVIGARVNLSRKRVAITATPQDDPSPWIAALAAQGYEAHEARDAATPNGDGGLVLRLGVAGFAMMNVMLLSVAVWSGADDSTRDLFHWIAALISVPAALFCAQPFFTKAWSVLRVGRLNMDVPISLAILLAITLSMYETMTGGTHAYFDAALSLTFFLLAGRVLEARMRRSARSAAADIAALEPRRVIRLENGEHVSRPVADLLPGDLLWLAAGARVPVDAETCRAVEVDRSALTGESAPVPCEVGAPLQAGDVILSGPVVIEAKSNAQQSTLRRMAELASIAEGARSRYTSLADRAAKLYAPLVHGLSFAAFAAWMMAGAGFHWSISVAIATLIITCPCALGLAVPAVSTVATGRLFRSGILVKSETALERLAEVDTVVLDKTGTVTRPVLSPPQGLDTPARQVLKALARASDHPLAKSLAEALGDVEAAPLSDLREEAGKGVSAIWGDRKVRLGAASWIGAGQGTVFDDGHSVRPLTQSEEILPGAEATVAKLTALGLHVHLLTGDRQAQGARIAHRLGVDSFDAEVSPEEKLSIVQEMQSSGAKLAMVGDGLNDTLALTEAWVSLAPGSALEASQNAADIVILRQDLGGITDALRIARSARRRILENFGIAATYNCISVPLAVMGFATPLAAALAMSTSSICVTLNALRTR